MQSTKEAKRNNKTKRLGIEKKDWKIK